MKKIIAGLLAIVAVFVSCTDQEEIEIAYQTNMSITASHIFDDFSTVLGDEFEMQGTNYGEWDLNLHAFIYDINGNLVQSNEAQYSSLENALVFDLDLLPGKYSVIAIAEFTGIVQGQNYKFWNISNAENLNDLNIVESSTICNSPFETLGITSKEFEIGEHVENITIDIKPVTGLLQVIIWDDDFTGTGQDGFSFYAPYIEELTIFAQDLKQVVEFNGSVNPTYDYGDQATRYPIQTHSPKAQYEKRGATQVLGFRALLPQENRDFYFELNCVEGTGQYLFTDGNDWQMSDLTDNKPNIESGKQYVMDLILDQTYLYVDSYNSSVDMFERIEKYIDDYNKIVIRRTLNERYDKYVGMGRNTIETYLNQEAWYTTETTASYWGTGLISMITARFTDSTMEEANRIMLTWNIEAKQFELVTEVLSEMYTPLDNGTTENVKQFINNAVLEQATVGISWDKHNNCLYFDAIN
ncbi:FimB/Mfa2 family fimbrial subunit [Phocaeicola sp. Sa1CVN1]|uniref:FimB/Mfa2 family fimbrial subunit n=1 Tax=Phocaeicola intestinalis TaxID=2762212 RepID=A0ABR8Y728_9BACT|nr:FimB/Mfa2 family fimbrial subunit [Phocaeicola intestinalis]MBD8039972.1 FimB/Mfa2 family fimbrial subunit [Phocaeicola intestinalis]